MGGGSCSTTRETDATPFGRILEDFLARTPGAYAAVLVDPLGETVDYAGHGEPFDLQVAAAHVRLGLGGLEPCQALGETRWLVLRGTRRSIAAMTLHDGYALVVALRPRAVLTISQRAIERCRRALELEAGWPSSHEGPCSWFEVGVAADERGRPTHLGPQRHSLEIIGTLTGLRRRERGFRVRTSEGRELTLIFEPPHGWYADQPT